MTGNEPRKEYHINLDWKFKLGDEPTAWQKGFDDSTWQGVTIPHDWAVESAFDKAHSSGTGYLPGGVGYYRKTFYLPKEAEGKRIYVTFDGVYNNSMVWCNSYYLGNRPSGYSRFRYEITDFACFGETPNVLTVKVEHRDVADSRWFTGSGIYRNVILTVKEKFSIDHDGVFIATSSSNEDKAQLSIKTSVSNATAEQSHMILRNTLFDKDGKQVYAMEEECTLAEGENKTISQNLILDKPTLWSTDHPYLYTMATEILVDGMIMDSVKNSVGIRTFSFDADKGFFLNQVNMKLKGVCVHHDAGCLGAAVRASVWERRLSLLKEMGTNAIRMSHNPHMPELYDLCDAMGFLVIDEAFDEWEGVKNKWANGHNVYPPAHYGYYENFPQWHEADLSSMVLRDRNHPSVIMWSIGNEIDYPNDPYCHPSFTHMTGNNDANKPAAERQYDPNKPNSERITVIAKKLTAIVKEYDETRPVTAALAFPELSNTIGYADCLDVVGYNYKEYLYNADHEAYPNRILLGSENGKDLAAWLSVSKNDFISGQFLWTGIDFLGETSGWPSHGSHAGLLDIAGFEKPLYYFRQSLWLNRPMAKIVTCKSLEGNRTLEQENLAFSWNYDIGETVRVFCFTNCMKAELFLNGESLGIKKRDTDAEKYFLAWDVPFEKGQLKVISWDESGNAYEDQLITAGEPYAIKLTCTSETLRADGQDMTHVFATIVDSDGNLVPDAAHMIHINLSGSGKVLGIENGNLEDTMAYNLERRTAYHGKLLIYVGAGCTQGDTVIKAIAEGLKGESISIT